jgi:heme-degrading monooxygenase HmoA
MPRAGRADDFARTFVELEIFEHSRRSGGFLGGRLLRPFADGEPFVVVAEWEDAGAYQGWLDNPVRAELGERLEPLLDGDVASGQLYEEVS